MKRQTKVRLCFAILVLAATLGFTGIPPQEALAIPCCDQSCSYIYDNCINGLVYPTCARNPTCCANKETVCYSHCNPYC